MAERRSSKDSKSPDSKKLRKGEEEEATDGKQEHQKKTGLAGKAHWMKKRLKGEGKSGHPVQHEVTESTAAAADTSELDERSSPPPLIEEMEELPGQWDQWRQPSAATATNTKPPLKVIHPEESTAPTTGSHGDLDESHARSRLPQSNKAILPDPYKPVPSTERAGKVNTFGIQGEEDTPVQTRPYTQPLLRSPHQPEGTQINMAQELAKAELERDRYKRDIGNKDRQIEEYQLEIVKLKTQARTGSPRQQQQLVVDHSAVVQLEEKEKQLNRQLVERDARVSQLEREKEDNRTALSNLEQSLAEKESQLTALNEKVKLLEKRNGALMKKDKEFKEVHTVKHQLEELKRKVEELGQEREYRENEWEQKFDHMKHQLQEHQAATDEAKGQADIERKEKEKLQNELNTSAQEVAEAKQQIGEYKHQLEEKEGQKYEEQLDAKDKEIFDLTTAIEEQKKQFKGQLEEKEREILQKENDYKEDKGRQILAAVDERERQLKGQMEEKDLEHQNQLEAKDEKINDLTAAIEEQGKQFKGQLEENEREILQKEKEYQDKINATIEEQVKEQLETKGAALQLEVTRLQLELDKAQREIEEQRECERNLREEMKTLQEKAGVADEGASANNSLSEEEKGKRALEMRIGELEEQLTKLETDKRELRQQYADKETALRASHQKELTMRQKLEQQVKEQDDQIQRNAARTKSLIKDTTAHFEEEIKKKDEEIDTYSGQLSHIGTELQDTKELLKEKDQELMTCKEELNRCKEEKNQVIANLKSAVEERTQTVTQLRKQLEKGNTDAKQVTELVEKLQLKEQECAVYKMDFESERNDRQRLNQTLTDQLEQVTGQCEALKQEMSEEKHKRQQLDEKNKKLEDENTTLKELVQPLTEEADKVKNFEEEIQILTAQVNAYSRKGDELKRALTQSQERYKTLETDKKTSEEQLENQLTILRGELESKEYSLNQEQARVTSLQQEVSKLQDLSERTKKANKTLVQKLKESQQQSTAPISKSPTASPHMHGRADNMAHSSVPPPTQYGSEIPPTQYKAEDLLTRSEDPPTQYSPDPPTQYRAEGPPNHKPNLSTRRNPNSPIAPADVQQPKTQTDNSEGQIVVPSSQPEGDSRSSSNRNSDTLDVLPQFTKEQMSRRFKQTQSDKETDTALKELDEMRKTYSARPLTGPIPNNAPVGSQTVAQKPVKPRDDSNIKGEQTKDDPLPYDPNLVCPKCGKRFHIGGVQKFRHHVKNKCPGNSSAD